MPADFDCRSFLGGSLLTLAAAPAAASGSSPDEPDVDGLLADESTLLATSFLTTEPRPEANALLSRSLATLLWTGLLTERAPSARMTRLGQARLPAMMDAVFANGLLLERTTPSEFAAMDRSFLDDPPDEKAAFFTSAVDRHIPALAALTNRRVHAESLFRLRHEGSEAYAAGLLARLDRVAERHGVDWRAEALGFADRPFEAPLGGTEEPVVPMTSRQRDRVLYLYEKHGRDPEALLRRGRNKTRLGAVLLSIGIASEAAMAPVPLVLLAGGACAGAALIVAGIVLIARGARLREIGRAAAEAGL